MLDGERRAGRSRLTAPPEVRFCVSCGAPMASRTVAGTPRRVCTGCGAVHYADPKVAVCAVVRAGERVLLVRRGREPYLGAWGLPGGFLDRGEDPGAAAARETAEEAGIEVVVTRLLDVTTGGDGAADLVLVYAATHVSGTPRAGDDAADAAFFPLRELPPLAFASTRAAIARLRSGGEQA